MLDISDDDDALPEAVDPNTPPRGADGPSHVSRECECDLTDAEVRERGQAMAQDEREVERLKLKRKQLNAVIRGKLDHMTELAIAIDSRKETRDVMCTWTPDYKRGTWTLTRDDTGAELMQKQMTAVDRQVRLPLDTVDGDAAGTGDDDVVEALEAVLDDLVDEGLLERVERVDDVIGEPFDINGDDDELVDRPALDANHPDVKTYAGIGLLPAEVVHVGPQNAGVFAPPKKRKQKVAKKNKRNSRSN